MLTMTIARLVMALTGLCVFTIIFVIILMWKDTLEFRKSIDSDFLKSEKEAQTRREFKSYNKLSEGDLK